MCVEIPWAGESNVVPHEVGERLLSKADVLCSEDVLEVMRCGSDVPASLVDVMKTKALAILEDPWCRSATPDDVVLAVQLCGPLAALTSLWSRVEELQEERAFSMEQIVTVFSHCARVEHLQASPHRLSAECPRFVGFVTLLLSVVLVCFCAVCLSTAPVMLRHCQTNFIATRHL